MKIEKILIILILILSSIYIIYKILFPSYLSFISSCNNDYFEERYGDKYYTAGEFIVDGNETKLNIYSDTIPVLKHELCHLSQYQNNRLYGCNKPLRAYINEVECYSVETFWEILGY